MVCNYMDFKGNDLLQTDRDGVLPQVATLFH